MTARESETNGDWQPGCVLPDSRSEFERIPTWMWTLVFVLVAVLLLTYAGLLMSQLTSSTVSKRKKQKSQMSTRVTVSRRSSSTGSESPPAGVTAPFILRPQVGYQSQLFDCRSSTSGTVNSHLVAVRPGFYRRDRACQTDDAVTGAVSTRSRTAPGTNPTHFTIARGHVQDQSAHPDYEQSSLASSLSIDTPGTMTLTKNVKHKTTVASTQSFDSSATMASDRDLISHLTATGLYGKAGERLENSLPKRIPNVPGFRVVEQPNSNVSSLKRPRRPTPGTARVSPGRYGYSVTEEDGILFHEIHFAGGVAKQPVRSSQGVAPHRKVSVSESDGGSVFTGASYSDIFGDVEPRTANVPDGASATGEPHGVPLQPMFEWDYSSAQRTPRQSSRGSGERLQKPLVRKKVIEVEC